jgi:O-succinylbenzoate synthase
MHIDRIDVFHIALPLRKPQPTPCGPLSTLETVVVRMSGEGMTGWGEASPGNAPLGGPEWASGVFLCVRDWLAPRLVGSAIHSGQELQERLAAVRGNPYAKAALDTAWWDLQARTQGQSLPQLLGKAREAVDVGTSFDRMETIDELLEAVGRAFAAGYGRVELKFRPGWDVHMLNLVRQNFPSERLHIDVEGALRLEHMEMLCRLDDFCLAMIEQPLAPDDLVGHAMVQETIRTPLCLDESIASREQADMALELHSAKYINLKPGRVGGLTPAVAIHNACHDACVPCWVGATPQTALGTRIGLALAGKANCVYPADLYLSQEMLETDLAAPPAAVRDPSDGILRVPLWSEPGIGVEPDGQILETHCLAKAGISNGSSPP